MNDITQHPGNPYSYAKNLFFFKKEINEPHD